MCGFKMCLMAMWMLVIASFSVAQITITPQDFPDVGALFNERSTEYAVNLNLGPSGPDCTWTVSGYPLGAYSVSQVLLPSETPFAGSFPTATHTSYNPGTYLISYAYLRIASNGIWVLGRVEIPFEEDPVFIIYDQETLGYPLPLTYGSNWTDIRSYTITSGPDSGIAYRDSIINLVDGWGTLSLDSVSLSVLRVRAHTFKSRTLPGQPPDSAEKYSYEWISNEDLQGAYMFPAQFGPDSIFTFGYVGIRLRSPVAATVRGPVAEHFTLAQNYPNPFNASTTLPLELDRYARVTLSIYDETGRIVSRRDYELPMGRYELPIRGDDWSSGTYFARVSVNHRSQTTKMHLIK